MDFNDVKIEIYIPGEYVIKLREELNRIKAITIGNYDNVLSYTRVKGSFRPLEGANPFSGEMGVICEDEEYKVELRCKIDKCKDALRVIKEIHPYEEPVINVLPILNDLFK